jgi:hypothetical protein
MPKLAAALMSVLLVAPASVAPRPERHETAAERSWASAPPNASW